MCVRGWAQLQPRSQLCSCVSSLAVPQFADRTPAPPIPQVLLAVILKRVRFQAPPNFDIATRASFTLASRDGLPLIPLARD
jgi:hypothetical protein